jgi:hypothetical protein
MRRRILYWLLIHAIAHAASVRLLHGLHSIDCLPEMHIQDVGTGDERLWTCIGVAKHYLLELFVQAIDLAHRMSKAFTASGTVL